MGGNAFKDVKRVPKESIDEILDFFYFKLDQYTGIEFNRSNMVLVGSASQRMKEDYGDLDLITTEITSNILYDTIINNSLFKHEGNIDIRLFNSLGFVSFYVKGYQIDVNYVKNLEWSKFAFTSEGYNSRYKALYRNEIFYVLAALHERTEFERSWFTTHDGYHYGVVRNSSKVTKKILKKSDYDILIKGYSPETFLNKFFACNFLDKNNVTFEQLIKAIKDGCLLNKNYDEIYNLIIKGLEKKNVPIPYESLADAFHQPSKFL